MRQILTTVYALNEIPNEDTRCQAINELRNDLIAWQAQEIYDVLSDIKKELECRVMVTVKDLRDAANKVGWCWGFDVVENYINRTHMHGLRSEQHVMPALMREADEIVRYFDDNPEKAFSDDDVIEHANANEYEYREDGKLI